MGQFFVTGTDTGVGKTLVTAALLAAARQRGWSTVGLKPLAAGARERAGRLANDDALLLQSEASVTLDYAQVNPVLLREAMAPHLAAAHEGRVLRAADLIVHCRDVARRPHDLLLAEGAGGWLVPLNASETMADVARGLGWPVILVVGLRLGCLNHALLSVAAIRSSGLVLAGWVANGIDARMAAIRENVAAIEERIGAPHLGTIPWLGAAPGVAAAARCLKPERLSL